MRNGFRTNQMSTQRQSNATAIDQAFNMKYFSSGPFASPMYIKKSRMPLSPQPTDINSILNDRNNSPLDDKHNLIINLDASSRSHLGST